VTTRRLLVVGGSGIVGRGALAVYEHAAEWDLVTLSRRPPDFDTRATHVSLDLTDAAACRSAVERSLGDVSHVIFTAVHELPDLIPGWRSSDHVRINAEMFANLMDPLSAATELAHVIVLQGAKAYGVHIERPPVPAKERDGGHDHDNFYWHQEARLRQLADAHGFSWTIFRPHTVVGFAPGSPMNILSAIGAYGALCRAEGRPMDYPGGPPFVLQAIDADLMGRAMHWAMVAPTAVNEIFNITNGDVMTWPDLWPDLADALGVEAGRSSPVSLAETMPARAVLWDSLVSRHDLRPFTLDELVGSSWAFADFNFALGKHPGPALLSTIKLMQAGFTETLDTADMFKAWFARLMADRILPPR